MCGRRMLNVRLFDKEGGLLLMGGGGGLKLSVYRVCVAGAC